MLSYAILVGSLLSLCLAQSNDTLTWTACPSSPTFQCSQFSVPLDYANPSAGQAKLAVARLPAQGVSQGVMFVNPGGPGASGIDFLINGGGQLLSGQIGGTWDIVSWDPRGVGASEPILKWFLSTAEEQEFWSNVTGLGTFEAHGNLTTDADYQFFLNQAPIMDERLKAFDELAIQRNGDNLKYVGTAAVVRDLASLVDAIDGPGRPINFYGYSYGTAIAAYLTQMFPERVGRVVIDGVVDPSDYTEDQPYLGWDLDLADAEATWDGFLTACAEAGPTGCLFNQGSDTKDSLNTKVNNIIDVLYHTWNTTSRFSQNEFTETLFSYMYSPNTWNDLGTLLNLAWGELFGSPSTGGRSIFMKHSSQKLIHPLSPIKRVKPFQRADGSWYGIQSLAVGDPVDGYLQQGDYALIAITCSDAADSIGATTTNVFEEMRRVSQTVSQKWGASFSSRFFCHRWSTRAIERYAGPWNKTTANPVIVIGNQADPICPYRSAKLLASEGYLGSSARLVQRWDFGHTSGSETSLCINSLIANYTSSGDIVPADNHNDDADLICPTNDSLLGLPADTHFNPVTSQNGDALTSGPNDPGLADLHNTTSNSHTPGTNAAYPQLGRALPIFPLALASIFILFN